MVQLSPAVAARSEVLFDTLNGVDEIAEFPSRVQNGAIPAGTTAAVQARAHPDAPWVEIAALAAGSASVITDVTGHGQVRVQRLTGAGEVIAWAVWGITGVRQA